METPPLARSGPWLDLKPNGDGKPPAKSGATLARIYRQVSVSKSWPSFSHIFKNPARNAVINSFTCRVKRKRAGNLLDNNKEKMSGRIASHRQQQISAFTNPGYEGASAIGAGGKGDFGQEDAGTLPSYEEITEIRPVTESIYADISMEPIASVQNNNAEGGIGESV